MKAVIGALYKHIRRYWSRLNNKLILYKFQIRHTAKLQYKLLIHRVSVFCAKKPLKTINGKRFLELESLLSEFLLLRFLDQKVAKSVASQLLNVLKHCDEITYEEPGTAEAYAVLHFLDRYHRFQLIFEYLHQNKLMPCRNDGVRILDVGTGPGPSMYAASDFYSNVLSEKPNKSNMHEHTAFSIDYVERSYEFRNWLHHFTEFVNYYSPTQAPWLVPFHHGTFSDFENLEFNQKQISWESDDDGDEVPFHYVRKHRFDLIVFSNFLTTKEQTASFSKEIENCVRYLRNNGILVVVGAKSSSKKYKEVYEEIERTISLGRYSNRKLVARCQRIKLDKSVMGYSWKDEYGERLKMFTKLIFDALQAQAANSMLPEVVELLRNSFQPDYSRPIEWELLVFRKKSWPRRKKADFSVQQSLNNQVT